MEIMGDWGHSSGTDTYSGSRSNTTRVDRVQTWQRYPTGIMLREGSSHRFIRFQDVFRIASDGELFGRRSSNRIAYLYPEVKVQFLVEWEDWLNAQREEEL